MRRHGRDSGAEVDVDGDKLRLKIWAKHVDEFVMLDPGMAKLLGLELIAKADEVLRLNQP